MRRARDVAIVLLVCVGTYWIALGAHGFGASEGHRVAPAWEMLETGDFGVTRMFGTTYLRKPPGVIWSIATTSAVLGETEFGARAGSALASTLMAILALSFATRWFGPRWALPAGLAQAVAPVFIQSGRTAEIEPLHNLATQATVFLLLDALLFARTRRASLTMGSLAGVTLSLMLLTKGPAGLPCVLSAVVACVLIQRGVRGLRIPSIFAMLVVCAIVTGGIALRLLGALSETDGPRVTQSVGTFLFADPLASVLLLPTALATALPASLALLIVLTLRGKSEADRTDPRIIASALALTCTIAIVIYALSGVSNPRYTWPALTILAPLAAVVWSVRVEGTGRTQRLARTVFLGHVAVWPIIGVGVAAVQIAVIEPKDAGKSGKDAGVRLGELLPESTTIWANDAIEARPEVLLYARRRAAQLDRVVSARWIPEWTSSLSLPESGYVLVRQDPESDEEDRLLRTNGDAVTLVERFEVDWYRMALYRVD